MAEADKKNVLQASIIAQVAGTFPVTFADVEVQSSVHLKRNRVSIQNCIRKIMEDNSSALIFFHFADNQNEWRVSFAHRAETLQTSTSAKRYTYLCGIEHPCRTIAERFQYLAKKADSAAITVEDMLNAFSVEALSKEFFAEYKVFYEDFVQYITGKRYIKAKGKSGYENRAVAGAKVHTKIFAHFQRIGNGDEQKAEKKVRDYIKKMMGRLVFIQFLQKKGWLGCTDDNWNDGDRDYLQHLFERSSEKQQNDFLSTVLDPLFFGMLNTNPEDRARHFKQKGWDKTLLDRFGKVPYLNGGLFEEDPEDSVPVIFPAVLFGNPKQREIERTFRIGQNNDYPYDASCGLLDFFARYNFTIDETDPEDREVGVDPEMLGKIFENLLEDNKDKGAFYTPKEIVQYMCRESLIAYLAEEIQDEPAMRDLVLKHETARIKDKNAALSALKTVKICDPAVGSGAFPMGMLNELFACRMLLEGDSSDEENRSRIKKDIVRENIYGVDIEKGAVDIARLRFWLAIIVDEKIPLPLPNLDYKIMQGNSLLESYEGEDLSNLTQSNGELFDSEEMIEELLVAINGYYIPKDNIAKSKIRKQIEEKVILLLKERQLPPKIVKALEKIDLHENNNFFLWHTWFSEVFNRPADCKGFDIVIGNPPYVQLQDDGGKLAKMYKPAKFNTFNRMGDIYQLFYEKGIAMLRKSGHICYITSNKWMRAGYGETSRKYFAEHTQPKILIDLAGEKVFENATVDVNILLLQKAAYTQNTYALRGGLECLKDRSGLAKQPVQAIEFPKNGNSWVILSDIEQRIKQKIEAVGTPLKEWNIKIYRGILTGCNEAFIINKEKRDELIKKCPKSAEIIRPILRGKDIKKYGYNFADKYLIFIPWHFPLHGNSEIKGASKEAERAFQREYLAIYNHLLQYKDQLSNRNQAETGIRYEWYALQRFGSNYWDDFSKPKICWNRIASKKVFALVDENILIQDSMHFFIGDKLKYLCAMLNSNLFRWFLLLLVGNAAGGNAGNSDNIKNLKLYIPCLKEENRIEKLMEYKNYKEIDNYIYDLYKLTKEEINLVEVYTSSN
ncbi:Eco57I restriction-modification methylase domain-containing protein [Treponema putidum]|uniref:Eco57I restriction-modification methylase domain-containing protein n=1 Tax=Treponema putidum TaxID=221027 RepID=UPI00130DDE8D|nr:N-6 DNA methylase [Treponema putidum]